MRKAKKKLKQNDVDVIIYSKDCALCEFPEEIKEVKTWALNQKLSLAIIRTAFDRTDHKRASEIWGDKRYPAFVVHDDVTELKEFVDMIKNSKNKMVKEGESKDVDLQRGDAENPMAEDSVVLESEKAAPENDEG